jgi:hypothetical protein
MAIAALAATLATAGINGGARQLAKGEMLLLIGANELVRSDEKSGSVLGQQIPAQHLSGIDPTATIFVFGFVRADGSLYISRTQASGTYVPGSTSVLLTGVLEAIDRTTGRAVVNGVAVDIVTLLAGDMNAPAVGSIVRVTGIQPSIGGVILATAFNSESSTQGAELTALGINGGAITRSGTLQGVVTLGINGGAVR